MTQTSDTLASLVAALGASDEEGKAPSAVAWRRFAQKFLRDDETVLLALEGEGWTWWDSILVITNQRVMRMRQLPFQPWRLKQQAAPAEVLGAEFRPWPVSGIVRIRVRGKRPLRVMSASERTSRAFVDRLHVLVHGGRG